MPAKHDSTRSKAAALSEEGTLNPAPEKVRDPKFREGEFFDPRDAVQVKYEMLRRVSSENPSVTDASDEYGVSRPTYYQAKSNFDEAGIAGLVPKKRGPHGPHKIHGEVLAFLRTQFVPGEPIRARELARLIRQEFGLDVHPRTIERAVSGKKHATLISEAAAECSPRLSAVIAQYETLRMATLGEALPLESRSGLALFLRRGMWGWARTLATTSPWPVPISATPSGPMESRDRSVIIHVFAAMAVEIANRRAP